MDQVIAGLNEKIDRLAVQVQYLADQAQLAERAREERGELMNDFMPVANDALRLATAHLQEVDEYVRPRTGCGCSRNWPGRARTWRCCSTSSQAPWNWWRSPAR